MKIVSVHVQAFGKLREVTLQLNDGINVIQDVNGFGKTTMASFIRAMLYGFTYRATGGVKDSARFAPWQGTGRFGGSMVVSHGGATYRIERFFGATSKQETLVVTNEKTGKAVELNDAQPGEYFLGLTADSYDRSTYFPQEAVALASNDNIDGRLANLIENGADDYDRIQEKLRNYKKSLRHEKGNGGKLYELELRRRELLQKQNDAERAERRAAEIDRTLAEIEAEKQALFNKKSGNKILLFVGIILAVVGAVFLALGIGNILSTVAYVVGAFGLAVGMVAIAVYIGLDTRVNGIDAVKRLNALSMQIGRLSEERKLLAFDSVAIEDELLSIAQQTKQAQFDYGVADTVSRLLAEAKDNLSSGYLPKLTARCGQLLSQITQGAYSVAVDRSFNVKIRVAAETHELSAFSRGIREITLLCFRVALSELLYDGAIPFIIVDDAFVNFDEDNFVRATKLLKQLSARAQVVYFTCHSRTGELLK